MAWMGGSREDEGQRKDMCEVMEYNFPNFLASWSPLYFSNFHSMHRLEEIHTSPIYQGTNYIIVVRLKSHPYDSFYLKF